MSLDSVQRDQDNGMHPPQAGQCSSCVQPACPALGAVGQQSRRTLLVPQMAELFICPRTCSRPGVQLPRSLWHPPAARLGRRPAVSGTLGSACARAAPPAGGPFAPPQLPDGRLPGSVGSAGSGSHDCKRLQGGWASVDFAAGHPRAGSPQSWAATHRHFPVTQLFSRALSVNMHMCAIMGRGNMVCVTERQLTLNAAQQWLP